MSQETHKKIRQTSLLLLVAMLVSRVIGFFREWALARLVGATGQTDVYLASFTIPDFLNYMLAAGALSVSFIPVFAAAQRSDPKYANAFFRVVSSWMSLVIAVFIILAMIFARPLCDLVAPGFEEEQKVLLTYLVRIILPAQFFFYWGGLANAVQQVHGIFIYTALGGIFYNLGIILCGVLLHHSYGVMGFSIGVLVGAICSHGLLQIFGLIKLNYSLVPRFAMGPEMKADFKRYLLLALPIMLGFSLVVTDEWISKYLASSLETKNVSWLTYARTLMRVPVAVVGQVAGIASFPFMAKLWAEKNFGEFGDLLSREMAKVWALGLLAAIYLFIFALPVTHLVYRGGKFGSEDLVATAELLRWLSLGIPFWIAQVIFSRGFYAAHITWLPSLVGTGLCIFLYPVYWKLQSLYGAKGLAMASAIGIASHCVILFILMRSHFGKQGLAVCPPWLRSFFFEWIGVSLIIGGAGFGWSTLGFYSQSWVSALGDSVGGALLMGGMALLCMKIYFKPRLGWDLV